jgi:hypothetical protein
MPRPRRRSRPEPGGLYIFIGADAETAWLPPEITLDRHGYVLTGSDVSAAGRWELERDPYLPETSVPGVFACGDVWFSPVKRVAAAVGEGSMAIAFVYQHLKHPEPGSIRRVGRSRRCKPRAVAPSLRWRRAAVAALPESRSATTRSDRPRALPLGGMSGSGRRRSPNYRNGRREAARGAESPAIARRELRTGLGLSPTVSLAILGCSDRIEQR